MSNSPHALNKKLKHFMQDIGMTAGCSIKIQMLLHMLCSCLIFNSLHVGGFL